MHKQFLLAALEQAWLGRGICAPNPSVGAVAVQYGKIISQSWHRGAGTPHAEVLLLESLPKNCEDLIIYVTLEPCNHWGRTPPCVDALIKYGIKQVVYGYSDPNPLVSANDTPDILRKHGILALHFPLPEIDRFYQSYRHWILTGKPWVTAKVAQTFDGKMSGPLGARAFLSNSLCAEFTHKNRLHTDIILTTARTVNVDDPLLNIRLPEVECAKPIAIIDKQLSINPQAKVFSQGRHCFIYHDAQFSPQTRVEHCSYHAMPLTEKDSLIDLTAVISHLGSLGFHDVWVEAGAGLFNALHQAELVNRTYVYLVPKIMGETALSTWQNTDLFNRPCSITWTAKGDNMIAQLDWQEDGCLPD